jgi:hypothetical protein
VSTLLSTLVDGYSGIDAWYVNPPQIVLCVLPFDPDTGKDPAWQNCLSRRS